MRIDLGSQLSVIDRLSDRDPTKHSGRQGSRGSITRDSGLLFDSTLPFSRVARRRGELGFCLGTIVVALQDRFQARSVQGSASFLTPFLFHLDRFLLRMNLRTQLLPTWLTELEFEAHQQVCGQYGFGRRDSLSRPSQALMILLSLFEGRIPDLHLW